MIETTIVMTSNKNHVSNANCSKTNVKDLLSVYPNSEPVQRIEDFKESIYDSSKRRPLGKTYERGFQIPKGLGTDIPFGIQTDRTRLEPFLYDPVEGESRKAKSRMDWEKLGIDIEKHRFGSLPECFQIKEKERTDVHQAMHYCKEETKQEAIKMNRDNYPFWKEAPLGKSKPLIPRINIDPLESHGKIKMTITDSVADLLRDTKANEETRSSHDSESSSFDGRMDKQQSVDHDASKQNIEQIAKDAQLGAKILISPPLCAQIGLDVGEQFKLRNKEELRNIMERAGVSMEHEIFDRIFDEAFRKDGSSSEACTLESFFQFRFQYLKDNSLYGTN